MGPLFSVIIPAHNEEKYKGKCLGSIKKAANECRSSVETVVVANRCTDRTAEIAERCGAIVINNQDKCISSIRNAGVKASRGRIIVTIDADSVMGRSALTEIKELLGSGKYIGGGALSGTMFWCRRRDFDRIGGFDESLVSLEDMDFARRLKALGKTCGKKYGTLRRSWVITSSRKFDEFGDWYLIKNRKLTKAIFTGKDREAADKFYYDVR